MRTCSIGFGSVRIFVHLLVACGTFRSDIEWPRITVGHQFED